MFLVKMSHIHIVISYAIYTYPVVGECVLPQLYQDKHILRNL